MSSRVYPMDRRSFCRSLAAVGALPGVLAMPARSAEASPAARQFRLCLSPGSIGVKATQQEAIDLAAEYGFEAVEPYTGTLAGASSDELGALVALLKERKLVWGAAGFPLEFRGDEARFQESLKALAPTAAALERGGVTRVTTWISPGHSNLTYRANFQQHQQRLRQAARILGDHGQRLGLEYVGTATALAGSRYPFLHTLAETRELIDAIGTGNVGFVLDSWHWWQAGDSEAELLALRPEEIIAVDLNDAPAGLEKNRQQDGQRELPVATGVIDLRTFVTALVRVGFDGPVRAEPFNRKLNDLENAAACAATIEALRRAASLAG